LPAFLDSERMLQASLFAGSDAAEGLRAVIEKRRPDFRPA
jgi:enoyl-CoA hydratase/carnithine racemase